jgi:predicted component of type VI protein secretion system
VKAATIFRLFKDVYTEEMEEVSEPLPIEVPYCFYSALQKMKIDKNIANLADLNPNSKMVKQLDMIPNTMSLQGIRA